MRTMKLGPRGFVVLGLHLAVAALGVVPDRAPAQERRGPRAGAGFFAIGGSVLEVSDLNDRLAAGGYPTFGRTVLGIGGGGYAEHPGGFLLGGEGYGLIAGEEAHQGRSVSLGGGYGLFNVGFMTEPDPHVRAYPMVGIGAGGFSLGIGSRPTAESFDDVLEDPDRSASLARGGFLFSLGGGLEYRTAPAGRGFVFGLRAGYLFAPSFGSWRLDGNPVGEGPDASIAGPYLRVTIGGGGG